MQIYTVAEIAELLSCREARVRSFIREGTLRARRFGVGLRIVGEDLRDFLDELPDGQHPDPRRDPRRKKKIAPVSRSGTGAGKSRRDSSGGGIRRE